MYKIKVLILIITTIISGQSLLAGEKDLYDFLWLDPDKSVYVLQNKLYPKEKSFYAEIGYLSNTTSTFQDTNGAQFKFGYYFHEEWALEFSHLQYTNSDNTTKESSEIVSGTVPFIRRPLSSTSIFAIWSPFYGKINTFNQIYYFDWYFGVGIGSLTMESNLDTAELENEDRFETETYAPIQFKTGLKFHINKNFHMSIDFVNSNFESATPKDPDAKSWDNINDLIFNVGVSF